MSVCKKLTIVIRCRNEMPYLKQLLEGLDGEVQESGALEVLFFDNNSSDGSLEEAQKRAYIKIVNVNEGRYVPGKILNQAISMSRSELVLFINGDAIFREVDFLKKVKEHCFFEFQSKNTAALFFRQVPRPSTWVSYSRDLEKSYATDESNVKFSMVFAALRKSFLMKHPFDEQLKYSEDVAWAKQQISKGFQVKYCPQHEVEHAHNYTVKEVYKRYKGDFYAQALAGNVVKSSRYSLGYLLCRAFWWSCLDFLYALKTLNFRGVLMAPFLRTSQNLGIFMGYRSGVQKNNS